MHTRQRKRTGGFTLVEMMIASMVLVVAVLATFGSQLKARDLLDTARETQVATAELQAAMERILLLQIDRIPGPASLYADGQPIAAFENRNLDGERIVADYPGYAGGTVPDPLPIVLTITWNDPRDRLRTLTLRSMKTR